jgi:transposase
VYHTHQFITVLSSSPACLSFSDERPVISCTVRLVVGGVDTHKNSHVAVIIDVTGRLLDTKSFPTMTAGYESLLA